MTQLVILKWKKKWFISLVIQWIVMNCRKLHVSVTFVLPTRRTTKIWLLIVYSYTQIFFRVINHLTVEIDRLIKSVEHLLAYFVASPDKAVELNTPNVKLLIKKKTECIFMWHVTKKNLRIVWNWGVSTTQGAVDSALNYQILVKKNIEFICRIKWC